MAGPDGALWFADRFMNQIGRIDGDSTEHIQATEEMPATGDAHTFHWEWILYLEISVSFALIIVKRLK
jgi:hypothetical protein